jgi:plasmid stability protein
VTSYAPRMAEITLDLPDELREQLYARAARQGQSLEEFLRAWLIELASTPAPELD